MDTDFEQTIKNNAGSIHKLCRVYTFNQDEYEQLFQEMLIQVWRSLASFRGEAKLSTWIYRICINCALSFRANIVRHKQRFEPIDGKVFVLPTPDKSHDEQRERLYAAIRELGPVDRAIASLYLEDESYEEIGELLGMSTTNVATRLMRLKRTLTEKLSK